MGSACCIWSDFICMAGIICCVSDNYALLKEGKNRDNAYKLINYLLRKDIGLRIINDYPYISSIREINEISSNEIKNIIKNGTYVKNIGFDIKYYDNLWAEIK